MHSSRRDICVSFSVLKHIFWQIIILLEDWHWNHETNLELWNYFSGLTNELVKNCDGELKTQLIEFSAEYEHRLTKGNKAIFHLEAFVAKFMAVYMEFMEETMRGFWNIFKKFVKSHTKSWKIERKKSWNHTHQNGNFFTVYAHKDDIFGIIFFHF